MYTPPPPLYTFAEGETKMDAWRIAPRKTCACGFKAADHFDLDELMRINVEGKKIPGLSGPAWRPDLCWGAFLGGCMSRNDKRLKMAEEVNLQLLRENIQLKEKMNAALLIINTADVLADLAAAREESAERLRILGRIANDFACPANEEFIRSAIHELKTENNLLHVITNTASCDGTLNEQIAALALRCKELVEENARITKERDDARREICETGATNPAWLVGSQTFEEAAVEAREKDRDAIAASHGWLYLYSKEKATP